MEFQNFLNDIDGIMIRAEWDTFEQIHINEERTNERIESFFRTLYEVLDFDGYAYNVFTKKEGSKWCVRFGDTYANVDFVAIYNNGKYIIHKARCYKIKEA
ncbi:MAG: hypothetical protein ACRC1D_10435 [Culicoidibacterales bacterium]